MMPCGALGCPHTSAVVPPPGGVGGELGDERVGGLGRAGDDEQPRAAGVEAVHDARALRLADAGDVGEAGEQAVDQRAVGLPAPGCTTSPAGLSTTITASSAWTTTNSTSASGSGGSATGIAAGSIATTGSCAQPHLAARDRDRRRRVTPPAAITAAAADRLTSSSRATTRSSRSPSSAARDRLDDHGRLDSVTPRDVARRARR